MTPSHDTSGEGIATIFRYSQKPAREIKVTPKVVLPAGSGRFRN